jgi:hypothetical protein
MSKYLGNKPFPQNTYTEPSLILKPTIDDATKSFIFSNINSGNYKILFEKITPDISLTFNDSDNNSVVHSLLKVDDKIVPENIKIKILQFFIRRGAPLNTFNKHKLSPLHIAINNGDSKIVTFLLENGSNPNAETLNKITPIQLALQINTSICKENIIPSFIGEIDIKDKNELKNEISKEIKRNFDNRYFNLFNRIFQHYKSGFNFIKEDDIYKEITLLTGDSKYNAAELKILIDEKIQKYIRDIAKTMDEMDQPMPNIDNNSPDARINSEYVEINNRIQILEREIDTLYDQKINSIKNIQIEILNYFNEYFQNFKLYLVYISKHVFKLGAVPGDRIRLFFPQNFQSLINPPTIVNHIFVLDGAVIGNQINMGILNPLVIPGGINVCIFPIPAPVPLIPGAGAFNYYNYEFNITNNLFEVTLNHLRDNFIKTMNLPLDILDKINNMITDLIKLSKINNLIENIDIASFNTVTNSYKFKILNYMKICNIINIINISLPFQKEIKKNEPNINDYTNNNIRLLPGITVANLLVAYPDITLFLRSYQLLFNLVGRDDKAKQNEIKTVLTTRFNLKLPTGVKLGNFGKFTCINFNDITLRLNEINTLKYYAKFINHFLGTGIIPPGAPLPVIPNLEKYFDKELNFDEKKLNQRAIKYKDAGALNLIILTPVATKVYAIDDQINNSEYQDSTILDGYLHLFSNREKAVINNINNVDLFNAKIEFSGDQYIERDDTIENYTVGVHPLSFLKLMIFYNLIDKFIDSSIPPSGISKFKKINLLLDQYNPSGIDPKAILSTNILSTANEILDELIKYYKIGFAKEILKEKLSKIDILKSNYILNDSLNIDIKKILGIDFKNKNKNDYFINESNQKYYHYNYISNNESMLCYKNNNDIIKALLNVDLTNSLIRDQQKNNILHYLVNIENYKLFSEIFSSSPKIQEKFCKMINLKNDAQMSPLDIINNKIKLNNNSVYKMGTPEFDTELIYSELYSDELMTKLRNNNELNSIIPNNINNIFNDIFIIFNLKDVNNDIVPNKKLYNELFNYIKTIKLSYSSTKDVDNIDDRLYNLLQERYKIDKYIESNKYFNRFYNTLVHVITLHFSSHFYFLIKKLLLEKDNSTKIGLSPTIFNELRKNIFDFDPTYENQNLAQLIILNIYKAKYNKNIIENKSLSSLKEILKFKLSILDTIIVGSRLSEVNENIDKVCDYMNIYFEIFNKQIILFLTSYVKFIELQYNLQQIRNLLTINK